MHLSFSLWLATSSTRSQTVSVKTVCKSLFLRDKGNGIKTGTGAGRVLCLWVRMQGEIVDYKGMGIVRNNCPRQYVKEDDRNSYAVSLLFL